MFAADRREFDAFLRSILDRPDDDLPRLIAADWLSEHGYAAEEQCLRSKRIPLDDWTVSACEALLGVPTMGRFIYDVCRDVVAFGSERVTVDSDRANPLAGVLTTTKDRLSPKQLVWVWRLVVKHRHRLARTDLEERARMLLPEGVVSGP